MDLRTELKPWREARNISQATLGEAVGVDQSTVSYWESGRSQPTRSARILLDGFIRDHSKAPTQGEAA